MVLIEHSCNENGAVMVTWMFQIDCLKLWVKQGEIASIIEA